ncbi:MAG: GNAT family N-acetyltransferase [Chloroflexota bacterium]
MLQSMNVEQQTENDDNKLLIRPARAEDRAAVLAFCVDTFSWGDYIAEVWDRWLADPQGQLLVAEIDGLPVGIQHVSFPASDEAWLQGLRVDPAVRRRGVATALFQHGMEIARLRGARVARLMTRADNEPVHHMMRFAGFDPAVTFTDLRAPADPAISPPETAVLGEVKDLWRLVSGSEALAAARGTFSWTWRSLELTQERLADHVESGHVFVARQEGKPAAMALVEWMPGDPSLWVGTLAGEAAALASLATQLRGRAGALGASEVMAYVPKVESALAPLRVAGYGQRPEDQVPDMVLFAKDLSKP